MIVALFSMKNGTQGVPFFVRTTLPPVPSPYRYD